LVCRTTAAKDLARRVPSFLVVLGEESREINPNRVEKRIGNTPDTLLRIIVETYDRLQSDESFTDWQ
jgi:hypothetical protein